MDRRLREQLEVATTVAAEYGWEFKEVRSGGKHPRVYFTNGQETRFYILSSSPSDIAGTRNFRQQIRACLTTSRKRKSA